MLTYLKNPYLGLAATIIAVLAICIVNAKLGAEPASCKIQPLSNAIRKEAMLTDCIYRSNDKDFCARAVESIYPVEMLRLEWEFVFRDKNQTVVQ